MPTVPTSVRPKSSDVEHPPLGWLLAQWQDAPPVSARSALVTVLGDAIAPLEAPVWLSDLITLGAGLGFSDRLVRTSVFRLTVEQWLESERIGRRSRYRLTAHALEEIASVNDRIYGPTHEEAGSDEWLLVFTGTVDGDGLEALLPHLAWLGFAEISPSLWARPDAKPDLVRSLFSRLGLGPTPALALARFDDVDRLVADPLFRESSGLAASEAAYQRFVDRYSGLAPQLLSGDSLLQDEDAFVFRTLVVHDFRRARLADPALPAPLVGASWVGTRARQIAGELYHAVAAGSWAWIETVTGLGPAVHHPARRDRFADLT